MARDSVHLHTRSLNSRSILASNGSCNYIPFEFSAVMHTIEVPSDRASQIREMSDYNTR